MLRAGISTTLKVYIISAVISFYSSLMAGFGNVSYIGFLPIDMYRGIDLPKHQHAFDFEFTHQS
jgi:hypothetical protein